MTQARARGYVQRKVSRLAYVFAPMWICLLICADWASAAAVTTSLYREDSDDFTWVFTWDGTAGPISFAPTDTPLTPPSTPPTGIWIPGGPAGGAISPVGGFVANVDPIPPFRVGSNLGLSAQHAKGPHVGVDQDPGNPFTVVVPSADYAAVTAAQFQTIFGGGAPCPFCSVDHNPHVDQYTLKYQRTAPGPTPVNFIFTGQHVVPEPMSIMLFGSGVLGLMGYSCRRRKRSHVRHRED
jgi:hypothetical protein